MIQIRYLLGVGSESLRQEDWDNKNDPFLNKTSVHKIIEKNCPDSFPKPFLILGGKSISWTTARSLQPGTSLLLTKFPDTFWAWFMKAYEFSDDAEARKAWYDIVEKDESALYNKLLEHQNSYDCTNSLNYIINHRIEQLGEGIEDQVTQAALLFLLQKDCKRIELSTPNSHPLIKLLDSVGLKFTDYLGKTAEETAQKLLDSWLNNPLVNLIAYSIYLKSTEVKQFIADNGFQEIFLPKAMEEAKKLQVLANEENFAFAREVQNLLHFLETNSLLLQSKIQISKNPLFKNDGESINLIQTRIRIYTQFATWIRTNFFYIQPDDISLITQFSNHIINSSIPNIGFYQKPDIFENFSIEKFKSLNKLLYMFNNTFSSRRDLQPPPQPNPHQMFANSKTKVEPSSNLDTIVHRGS